MLKALKINCRLLLKTNFKVVIFVMSLFGYDNIKVVF